jgi:hypothetical protein
MNLAIGEQCDTVTFHNYDQTCLSSLLPIANVSENPFNTTKIIETEKVEMKTVDQICQENGIEHISLLKSDTQGFDYQVVCGAREMLLGKKIDHVLIELNFIKLYENQSDPLQIYTFLYQNNFMLTGIYERAYTGNIISWCTVLFTRCT